MLGALGLAAYAALAHRQAVAVAEEQAAAPETADAAPEPNPWDSFDLWGQGAAVIESVQVENALQNQTTEGDNLSAFLSLIGYSEGTDQRADPYRVCYGYRHTVSDMSDHPAVTGEWKGEDISALGPQYKGLVSTAAGRYQLIRPTWLACKRALGLKDFSPASQDAAATYLIKQRGALPAVQEGRIETAITACRAEWASLPGSAAGQPQRKLETLLAAFTNAGGSLA